jgi:hypothetical protein
MRNPWRVLLFGTLVLHSTGAAAGDLESAPVAVAPVIDGIGDDAVWAKAATAPVTVTEVVGEREGEESVVLVESVYTKTHVYFRVSWPDTSADTTHKTWVWNEDDGKYVKGEDREDVLALAFEHTGTFDTNMRVRHDATWDAWYWKAARTNPTGYAMDKTHRYTKEKPEGEAKEFRAQEGGMVWIARPQDAGGSATEQRSAPEKKGEPRVPKYTAVIPSGSAADVRAKGVWQDGRWTVELSRKLSTGYADDTAFDVAKSYQFGVAVFDKEESDHHAASESVRLVFLKKTD